MKLHQLLQNKENNNSVDTSSIIVITDLQTLVDNLETAVIPQHKSHRWTILEKCECRVTINEESVISNAVDQSMPRHSLSVVLVHNITLTYPSSYQLQDRVEKYFLFLWTILNGIILGTNGCKEACLNCTSKLWIKYSINTKSTIQELPNSIPNPCGRYINFACEEWI